MINADAVGDGPVRDGPVGGTASGGCFLIADLGGTNARFAIVENGRVINEMVVTAADHANIASAIDFYLAARQQTRAGIAPPAPTHAALAVACPVIGDRVHLTNNAWSFAISELRERYGLSRLAVVNDFTATALSIPHLGPDDLYPINGGVAAVGAPLGVIGPGTGLGVGGLVPAPGGRWLALATEGGHQTLAALDARDAAVIDVLRARMDHVSAERVLSGMGLMNLHRALEILNGDAETERTPEQITAGATAGDPRCLEVVALFTGFLGLMAGNLALAYGARGGIYIAGGIVPKLIAQGLFDVALFRRRFEAKGRFRDYLAPIPTQVILHPLPALVGLAGLFEDGLFGNE